MTHQASEEVLGFSISGMHCASCASTIETALKALPGVEAAGVNFTTREASVVLKEASELRPEKIIQSIEKLGYQAQLLSEQEDWLDQEKKERKKEQSKLYQQLSWAAFCTTVIVVLGMPEFFPFLLKIPEFYRNLVQWILSSVLQFWVGLRFLKALIRGLASLQANMDTLIGLGTLAAYLYSTVIAFFPAYLGSSQNSHSVYFETQAAIITFIFLGFYLEARARGQTGQALLKLASLQSHKAFLLRGRKEIEVNIWDLRVGDLVAIKPGQRIPVDGIVKMGSSGVDESMMSGESLPLEKQKGDWVYAGSLNQTGYLEVEIKKMGDETALSQIVHLVRSAMRSKAPIARLADQVSAVFVPFVLLIACLSFFLWYFLSPEHSLSQAIIHFVAVLIVACPCALGLATPTALITGMGRAASHGILFRSGESLEKVIHLEGFLFDKTGTLTQGAPLVYEIILPHASPLDAEKALQIAASIEKASEHRLALAFLNEAAQRKIHLLELESFESFPGQGVKALLKGDSFWLGNESFLKSCGIHIDSFSAERALQLQEKWATPVYLASSKQALALFAIHDPLRPESLPMIEKLKKQNYQLAILSGDRQIVVTKVAQALGIETSFAEVLPSQKEQIVKQFQEKVGSVAMVGDGVNDAPALAAADVGIALASGSDIAREASDITLLRGSVALIPEMLVLAKKTYQTIRQNLFFSFFYNILLIPLAGGALQPFFNVSLNPLWASIAMASSSLTVVLNSLRLKRLRL